MVELLVAIEARAPGAKLLGNPDVLAEGGPLETVAALVTYLENV